MFLSRYAKFIFRFRWAILAVWLIATAASALFLPNLTKVVAGKGTAYLPNSAPSVIATTELKQIHATGQSPASEIIAIQNPKGITPADRAYFNGVLRKIAGQPSQYHIQNVTAAYNSDKSLASSFQSQDGTTLIALAGLPDPSGEPGNATAFQSLEAAFSSPPSDTHMYFTGDAAIEQDNMTISQQGVSKSATVTVVLVLVILLLVFRSIIAPIVTLLSIGMSFLITSGLVAWLAQRGLPTSTFTQTFLIAILFGAGTDYAIILMNRFREELTHGHPTKEHALEVTVRAVSKTVLFSGLTVFVSFAILYFAKFGLYQSAVGVSVGMLVTLLTCLIFLPAVLGIFGGSLFWPRRPKVGAAHKPFAFWSWTGGAAIRRPWWTLALLVIVLVPVGLLFTNNRTFDPMTDIPQAPSVKGFHVLASSFGQGKVMPVTVVIKSSDNFRTPEGLTTIQNLSHAMNSLSMVTEVDSATQPVGKTEKSFQLANQDLQLSDSMSKIESGLKTLNKSLVKVTKSSSSSESGITKLVSGSKQVTQGLQSLNQALQKTASGTQKLDAAASQLAQGATSLQAGITQLQTGLVSTNQGAQQLQSGLSQAATSTEQLDQGAGQLSTSQSSLESAAKQLANALSAWAKAHPQDGAQPSWQQIMGLAQGLSSGEAKAAGGASQLATGVQKLSTAMNQLSTGASKLAAGTQRVANGGQQVANGTPSLTSGAQKLASAIHALNNGENKLAKGASSLAQGSNQVTQGIHQTQSGTAQLFNGYAKTQSAVSTIASSVQQINNYLHKTGQASQSQNPGFYVPASTLKNNAGLQKAMNAYISKNGHVAKFSVVLNENPYSAQAIDQLPTILHAAQVAFTASPIHTGTIHASGATATQADLNSVSSSDFVRTMVIVLCAIWLLLVVMLRSVLTPLYIIASLGGAYFVTMGILQTVAVHVMKEPGISWVAPFFVFLLLVALGVDYSIFLMSRYEEEIPRFADVAHAMREAMVRMGGVVFSAALIMAGTFGSLAASGVTSLIEIATGVVIGLLIYTSVFIALFVPASAKVIGDGHFWPFGTPKRRDED